ncbi:SUR7/PalI family protein [Sporobolomyces koalae]|uniref:SUR7/PalI family protein n=1 Tax=Sporobolomyces koalae TaxID=500713 RepID=UPI00316B7816
MVNCCASFGILFSWAAVILLVFGNIAQINPNSVPRHLRIVSIDTSGLAQALTTASGAAAANFTDIYNSNTPYFTKDADEARHDGLRKTYEWGLWSYCATNGGVGADRSYCEDATIHPAFQPAKVLMADIPQDYTNALSETLPNNVFTADDYLGRYTRAASYLIMIGSLATAIAALFALFARRCAFSLAAIFSIIAFLALAIGLIIYTVIFSRAIDAINDATVSGVNVGITLTYGNALWVLWAACGCMLITIPSNALACCFGRNDKR